MKEITLTQGKVAIVDDTDFEDVSRFGWYFNKVAKRNIRMDGKQKALPMHRYIMRDRLMLSPEMAIFHKDGNKLNNTRSNLFASCHRGELSKGVTYRKNRHKWQAQIQINGVKKYLGCFDSKKEASEVYQKSLNEIFF